ncbi:hypothetical protein M2140_000038 [Clostridiales Family XIII bacterium PM5-7]
MRIDKTEVFNLTGAVRGMRNPMESWDRSDTTDCLGENDLSLCRRLIRAGSEHRKFLRQIMISVDIEAPLYWWKEFDTYKVGTTANSTSTMHKITSKPITIDCFETEDFSGDILVDYLVYAGETYCKVEIQSFMTTLIEVLESLRKSYIETKDKRYWKELIRLLPESWLQTRTITMNYENVWNMYNQRKNHKLSEWEFFCRWAENLPHFKELFLYDREEEQ